MIKKRLKRILSLSISMLLIFSGLLVSGSSNNINHLEEVQFRTLSSMQEGYMDFVYEFLEKVEENSYGGLYFDENGTLNVNMVESDKTDQLITIIQQFNSSSPHIKSNANRQIKTHAVKYSMEDLQASVEYVTAHMSEWGISTIGVNQETNQITITAKFLSDDTKARIHALVPEDQIQYVITDASPQVSAKIYVKPVAMPAIQKNLLRLLGVQGHKISH